MASPLLGDGRVTRERYWQLVEDGVIGPDDRVELLEGVIVSMAPQNPPHASVVATLTQRLSTVLGRDASIRIQLPLELGEHSVPEPDVAVVSGQPRDYERAHPTTALLVVEVADSSVLQDRLTKAALYAAAGIEDYWLVNLRSRTVEVYRKPIREERRYDESWIATGSDRLTVGALPALSFGAADLLPSD